MGVSLDEGVAGRRGEVGLEFVLGEYSATTAFPYPTPLVPNDLEWHILQ